MTLSVVRYAHNRKEGLESLRDFALPPSMIHEGLVFTWLVYPPLETPLYLPFSSEPTEKRHLLACHDEVWYTPEDMQIACGFSKDTIELIRGDGAYYATRGLSERARKAVYRHFKRKDYPNSYLNVTKKTWPLMRAKVSDDQRWCPDGTVRVIVVAAGVYCEEQPGPVRYSEGCIVHVRRDVLDQYTAREA